MAVNESIINPWPGPTDKRLSVHKVAWLMGQGDIRGGVPGDVPGVVTL
jgi:hypothetical protein